MWTTIARRAPRAFRLCVSAALAAGAASCSPGSLPGSPTPLLTGGGGGRYNGTITVRRLGGGYTITETSQTFTLSIVARQSDQITGRFEAGQSSGSLQGIISGTLSSGTFQATALLSTMAQQGSVATACDGRGQVTGVLSGVNLSWTTDSITYDNCPGLMTTSQAQAVAVSPIPGSSGSRAAVIVTVLGGASIARGTCGGAPGYPFTVEIAETSGVNVTFDSTFRVEERRNFGSVTSTEFDMPFTDLPGGGRRTYGACSPTPGTYQAFFSATDANNNRTRVASPIVTMGP